MTYRCTARPPSLLRYRIVRREKGWPIGACGTPTGKALAVVRSILLHGWNLAMVASQQLWRQAKRGPRNAMVEAEGVRVCVPMRTLRVVRP